MENILLESGCSVWWAIGFIVTFLGLGYTGAPLLLWTVWAGLGLYCLGANTIVWGVFAGLALIFNLPPIRRVLVTSGLLKLMKGILPKISDTERAALRAGDVWMERELFSGKPNFKTLMTQKYPELTAEEVAFIKGPVKKLCDMTSDWEITQKRDLPPAVWEFIKKERFWGMIIPKEYGGLGFSALAHSEILQHVCSRSPVLGISIMVPNSLGPAELLIHYGTKEQKDYYLPRLARGEEVPCFALTEPTAGSDAASIQANGVVFKGTDGKLYLRLNWNKRWITLAAVSTVLGMAFRLRDPENLLGKGVDPGITCALIPASTPGVVLGKRHDPLGIPFFNCPTQGHDVVVPVDAIIGGPEKSGQGWLMLMECLAAGRGISLPAQATVGAKYAARIAGAHATVRKQFGMSIGKFEGVNEPLAEITGYAYLMEAGRKYTLGALDGGFKPPVVTAMLKYYFTEAQRLVMNHAMDILGGQGISRGPKNLMASAYITLPISITVEGANILTRTLIIFGQGALRAHPYAFLEVEAAEANDVKAFDRAFFGHIGHIVRNLFRAKLLTVTRGYLAIPFRGGVTAKYYRRLAWASASFALMADVAMGSMGASLKTKGKTTGRFADILAWMYFATATLRRFEADGRRKEDIPLMQWSLDLCFSKIQQAFDALFGNFDVPVLGFLFRYPVRWAMNLNPLGHRPKDELDFALARLIQIPGEQRDRIIAGVNIPSDPADPLNRLEEAFRLSIESEAVASKIRKAMKQGKLKKQPAAQLAEAARAAQIITDDEFAKIALAEKLRNEVIQVDDFTLEEFVKGR